MQKLIHLKSHHQHGPLANPKRTTNIKKGPTPHIPARRFNVCGGRFCAVPNRQTLSQHLTSDKPVASTDHVAAGTKTACSDAYPNHKCRFVSGHGACSHNCTGSKLEYSGCLPDGASRTGRSNPWIQCMALRPARCLGAGRRLASASYVRLQTQANSISARMRNRGSEDGTTSWWSALGGAQQNLYPVPCVSLGSFDQSWELTDLRMCGASYGEPIEHRGVPESGGRIFRPGEKRIFCLPSPVLSARR